jgi:hypothetical protein
LSLRSGVFLPVGAVLITLAAALAVSVIPALRRQRPPPKVSDIPLS